MPAEASDDKGRTYTPEFKLEAVRLLEPGDRKAATLARELGISRNKLYKWREQLQGREAAAAFRARVVAA